MKFNIEQGVPLPEPKETLAGTLRKMQIGESVYIEGKHKSEVTTATVQATGRTGFKYFSAKENNGVRIWRTE